MGRRIRPFLPIVLLALFGVQCDLVGELISCSKQNFGRNASSSPSSPAARSASSSSDPSAVRLAATASLPMLNAFPTCQTTLDIGFSAETVRLGAMTDEERGFFACLPADPVQIDVMEGATHVVVEAAAVALPAPNPQTSVARFAIEGRSSITGGTASTAPDWEIQVGYVFPHTGSPTGNEPIVFGATLVNANDTGGAPPRPAVGSVSVDCGVGVPTLLALNENPVEVPVEATSTCGVDCSCTVNATLSGGAAATAGEAVQRLTVIAFNTNGLCGSNARCRETDPANPLCVDDFGCSNGSVGMPCNHDSQCDRSSNIVCAASGFCEDGSAGAPCSQAGDCAVGLTCRADVCSAT